MIQNQKKRKKILEKLSIIPQIKEAKLNNENLLSKKIHFENKENSNFDLSILVSINFISRNITEGSYFTFTKHHIISGNTSFAFPFPFEQFPKNEKIILKTTSNDGKFSAYFLQSKDGKYSIQIWNQHQMIHTNQVPKDLHGVVYTDDYFQCFKFSPDAKKLVYTAEAKNDEMKKSFWENDCAKTPVNDWGEDFQGKTSPCLFVYDIQENKILDIFGNLKKFEDQNNSNKSITTNKNFQVNQTNTSFGSAIWLDNDIIICCGYENEPFRLGMRFCYNRKCGIYKIQMDPNQEISEIELLTPNFFNAVSPRLNQQKTKIAFISNPNTFGTHNFAKQLCVYDLETKQTDILIDIPFKKSTDFISEDEFPGLFTNFLPQNCWISDDKKILINTTWGSSMKIIAVETQKKDYSKPEFNIISPQKDSSSWFLLDSNEKGILIYNTNPIHPFSVYFVNYQYIFKGNLKNWILVEDSSNFGNEEIKSNFENEKTKSNFGWNVFSIRPKEKENHFYESVFIFNKKEIPKRPLLVSLHGGPHSCYITEYSLFNNYFLSIGFNILCVNYRGSLGFHPEIMKSLLSKIGKQDSEDVKNAIDDLKQRKLILNESPIFIEGISFGGFITSHSVSRFPGFYKAAMVRNPVINIAAMSSNSDVPDWCLVESGLDSSHLYSYSLHDILTMSQFSPVNFVPQISSPVLVVLGCLDSRCKNSDGLQLYSSLKAYNLKTDLILYQDANHLLANLSVELDLLIRSSDWFLGYLQEN
ncbi:acylamino-acid-releasing enzyme [Anaeramoeba ignava]|uniref:acylaminoacyl-peptidase n=1 Tax=Anaeramoeba ignava TaxID=1746090 RepID=A0A9Q0LUG4_ANAIG|nr:acylamino-acid-releasing enzyme [Anaeramoeba ignava]